MNIVDGWLESARRVPSPNSDQRPVPGDMALIVLHCISLPPGEFGSGAIEQLFTNTLDPNAHPYFAEIHHLRVSAHILIRRDGEIIQFVPFQQRAWHAGVSSHQGRSRCNDFSVGIELEGTDDSPYEEAQYLRLNALLAALFAAYPGLSPERIAAHSDIAPSRKTDPGPWFDWGKLTGRRA
ncbi:1,6-anhydro-N-acetylmuramyl-L-alanine amidase AmpD [Methylomagnum sp.]